MALSFTNLFCKTAECPTSHTLLAFRGSLMSPKEFAFVESHLASCDFCSAELQLLSRHRCDAEEYSFAEMPAQLRRLAETLLKRSAMPFKGLLELAELHQLSH
jgi:anti-sigma factor RsiW